MPKKIILAKNSGFCFGVQRAVDVAIENSGQDKVYTYGPLIHNNDVVTKLEGNNVYATDEEEIKTLNKDAKVIIRSHGVAKATKENLHEQGFNVVDATCPYVTNIHKKVEKYYAEGYKIIIIGDENHPEIIGINGWCNNEALITMDGENLLELEKFPAKVCVVSQTTNNLKNFTKAVNIISQNSREILVFNTICSATEVRQKNAEELSKEVDLMVVIGGRHSSNTTKLYEICKNNCKNTILIENSSEINDNIIKDDNITIGVTAGASTPDWVIKEAISKMSNENELTMNDILSSMDEEEALRVGAKIKGKIITVNEKEAFLNINNKAEAVLPVSEVALEDNMTLTERLKVDDEVEVKVIKIRNEEGFVVVSLLELQRELIIKDLSAAFDEKTPISVVVKEQVKGGLICTFNSAAKVFMPASQVELHHVDDLSTFIGQTLEVEVIEYEKKNRLPKIVVSRRALLNKAKEVLENKAFETLKLGDIVEGEVKRITKFGVFIEVNGVDGLAHISELSWGKVNNVNEVLNIGDKVNVKIILLDPENRKLSLSLKQTTTNPWDTVAEKYPENSVVLGKVVRFTAFGAFVELEPGVDGLIHISQISESRIKSPDEVLTIGEEVKAKIVLVDLEKKRIELSVKEVEYMI